MTSSSVEISDDIIIVVDQSTSNKINKELVDETVTNIINELPNDYKVGIIIFGKESTELVKLTTNKEEALDKYLNNDTSIDGSATNIEEALHLAYLQFNTPETGRIIVVSDGRETDGTSYTKAKELADLGVRIDSFYITPDKNASDLLIKNIELPENLQIGAPINIITNIQSTYKTDALITLEIIDSSQNVIHTETINYEIQVGDTIVPFEYTVDEIGIKEIKATIEANNDTIQENNLAYNFIQIDGELENKVLIIEGTVNESFYVKQTLETYNYEVEVKSSNNLELSVSEATQYKGIILMNVKNSDLLQNNVQNVLDTYVKDYKGGLLTIGGERAYQKTDMLDESTDHTFSNLLPVESSTNPKPMAVVVVMDASSSMTNNGSTKFDLAKAASIASLEALTNQTGEVSHQFGLVTFDANLKDVIPLTSVENKDQLISQINLLESGFGTRYVNGLQEAKNMLSDPSLANAEKHILFLTDGGPQDSVSQYTAVLNSMTDISVSTIALGLTGENSLDPAVVEAMVREYNDRGAYYRVQNESQLDAIMIQDIETAQKGDFINDDPFFGTMNAILPELASISNVPQLNGYYGTQAKAESNIVMYAMDGDPLFVIWTPTPGSGKVASFTSDLKGTQTSFSESFVEDFIGKAIIEGMVSSVLPSSNITSEFSVGYFDQNNKKEIRVRTDLLDGESIQTTIKDPQGNETRVPLTEISATTFAGEFETNIPGLYELLIVRYDNTGQVISTSKSYSTFSYSEEFTQDFDEELTITIMSGISESGSYLYNTTNMFSAEAETITRDIDLISILSILSMILFLADIIIRKFKFKWSNEYFFTKTEQ